MQCFRYISQAGLPLEFLAQMATFSPLPESGWVFYVGPPSQSTSQHEVSDRLVWLGDVAAGGWGVDKEERTYFI